MTRPERTAAAQARTEAAAAVPGFSNGNAGILYLAPAGATAEARFDEVAFGTAPLSCTPP